ncbi:MAG: hypothetical protein COA79_21970 [Planctomycetota bacterium]|nr:MAG: hypothetical protein COA79_21970 [Planctomycetota bacterium]
MNLNPFTGIEKLINEHGSAVILKERIELSKDIISNLEKDNAELKKKLDDSILEIKKLKESLELKDTQIKESSQNSFKVKKIGASYYKIDDIGNGFGDPFCTLCFEDECKLISISQNPSKRSESICPKCHSKFNWQPHKNLKQ